MLTGGIDLSVTKVATISAFVASTQAPQVGSLAAILIALGPALLIGLANGIGVGLCRVHPLIMTLATGLIGIGGLQVYQRFVIATGSEVPSILETLGTGRTLGVPNALFLFVPSPRSFSGRSGAQGSGGSFMRWARTRRRRGCRACGPGT
jgi:ribose transport system permease protein